MKKSLNKQTIRYLLDTLRENEFKVYLVGGAVRDAMLKRVPQDVDLLTDAAPREIIRIFGDQNVKIVGRTFPVCLVNGVEISSADKASSHFPASDLARRDFTFNAMACDLQDKKIIDPFNGRDDLLNGLVRFTEDPEKRIKEDPVRMIRACRFLAMIEGTFAASAFEAIRSLADLLDKNTAKERIGHEIIKAMAVRKPSLFFEALHATGILKKIFPSLDRCYDLDGGPHHGETVFEHCMLVGDALPHSMPILRLAGFLHDTGKFDAAKIKDGHLTFAGHEKHDQALIRDLENLRFSVRQIQYIKALTRSHMRPLTGESTPKAVRRLLAMLKDYHLEYPDFMRMRIADRKGNLAKAPYTLSQIRERLKKLFDEINSKAVFAINDLEISGTDIIRISGKTAGPEIGKIKHHLFKKVLDDPDLNTTQNLKQLLATIDEQSYKGLT